MKRRDAVSSDRVITDKIRSFKASCIEMLFAFQEVSGEKKQRRMESWQGYCREERANKLLEVAEQSTERAELNL